MEQLDNEENIEEECIYKESLDDPEVFIKWKNDLVLYIEMKTDGHEMLRVAKNASEVKTLNVLMVGHTGAGKSSLIEAITGKKVNKDAWIPCTGVLFAEKEYCTEGGVKFIDKRGFEKYSKQELDQFDIILNKLDMTSRPHIVLYLHLARVRFQADVELEILKKMFRNQIPVIFVITDPSSVADSQLKDVRKYRTHYLSKEFGNQKIDKTVKEEINGSIYKRFVYRYGENTCFQLGT